MDIEKQCQLIQQVLHPDPNDAASLLQDLNLESLPTREQVHRNIENKLLLPRETLPSHWLPSYQVCDVPLSR